jgi:hypothetical protein
MMYGWRVGVGILGFEKRLYHGLTPVVKMANLAQQTRR